MKPEASSPHLQDPATFPYAEPDRSGLCPSIQPLDYFSIYNMRLMHHRR
jgi:hypothetical protein